MTSRIQFSNLNYILRCQLRKVLALTSSSTLRMFPLPVSISNSGASLSYHVFAVAFWRGCEKVVRSATRRVVAMMANVKWPRVFTIAKKIRNATGNPYCLVKFNYSVRGSLVAIAFPLPTSTLWALARRAIYFSPKADSSFAGKLNCDRFRISHFLNSGFSKWSGSFGASTSFEPLVL